MQHYASYMPTLAAHSYCLHLYEAMMAYVAQAIEPDLLRAASDLLQKPASSSSKRTSSAEDQDPQFPSYQIRITGGRSLPHTMP